MLFISLHSFQEMQRKIRLIKLPLQCGFHDSTTADSTLSSNMSNPDNYGLLPLWTALDLHHSLFSYYFPLPLEYGSIQGSFIPTDGCNQTFFRIRIFFLLFVSGVGSSCFILTNQIFHPLPFITLPNILTQVLCLVLISFVVYSSFAWQYAGDRPFHGFNHLLTIYNALQPRNFSSCEKDVQGGSTSNCTISLSKTLLSNFGIEGVLLYLFVISAALCPLPITAISLYGDLDPLYLGLKIISTQFVIDWAQTLFIIRLFIVTLIVSEGAKFVSLWMLVFFMGIQAMGDCIEGFGKVRGFQRPLRMYSRMWVAVMGHMAW